MSQHVGTSNRRIDSILRCSPTNSDQEKKRDSKYALSPWGNIPTRSWQMNSQSNSATAAKHQDRDHQHTKKQQCLSLKRFDYINTNKKNKSFPLLKMQGLVCVEVEVLQQSWYRIAVLLVNDESQGSQILHDFCRVTGHLALGQAL